MIQTKFLLFSYWWRMGQNRREKNGATEPISDLGGHEIWISCSIQLLPRHCITLLIRYTAGTSNYFALLIFSSSFLLLHLLRSFVRSFATFLDQWGKLDVAHIFLSIAKEQDGQYSFRNKDTVNWMKEKSERYFFVGFIFPWSNCRNCYVLSWK